MTTEKAEDVAGSVVRLRPGVELLGHYEGSGMREAHFLARRSDGQVVHLSGLVHAVTAALDGTRTMAEVADVASERTGLEVSVDNVRYLCDTKLAPAGLVAPEQVTSPGQRDESAPENPPARAAPLLALRVRKGLIPARIHAPVTNALRHLFRRPVVAVALVALAGVDLWLAVHGRADVADAFSAMLGEPSLLLVITSLTITQGVWHELGHGAAARYGGAIPGAMGAGIYLVWPVFYTDVTDSYRLDRAGRLRVDLGGVYFNAIFALASAVTFAATGFAPLLAFVVVSQLESLRQFLPFVRLDGYYVVADLAGGAQPLRLPPAGGHGHGETG